MIKPFQHNHVFPAFTAPDDMPSSHYVYIMANKPRGTLYIGVTNDIVRRACEHRYKIMDGFTERYNVDKLVYYEQINDANEAIAREKQLKNWHREWKINLVEQMNPQWRDLFNAVVVARDPETSSGS